MTTLDPLGIRRRLGKDSWLAPYEFGPDGWIYQSRTEKAGIIVTAADHDGQEWWHASIAREQMPTYDDLCHLHQAVWPTGWAYQVFAPPDEHINIHSRALHLWGRSDGSAMLPNFGEFGTI